MECAVCEASSELLYTCSRCGERLCATHQGRNYHACKPSTARVWSGDRWVAHVQHDADDTGGGGVDRPAAQLFPDRYATDGASTPASSPTAARPGYEPDATRPTHIEQPDSMRDWLSRQTYLSLTMKVGVVATLMNMLVFSTIVVAMSITLG